MICRLLLVVAFGFLLMPSGGNAQSFPFGIVKILSMLSPAQNNQAVFFDNGRGLGIGPSSLVLGTDGPFGTIGPGRLYNIEGRPFPFGFISVWLKPAQLLQAGEVFGAFNGANQDIFSVRILPPGVYALNPSAPENPSHRDLTPQNPIIEIYVNNPVAGGASGNKGRWYASIPTSIFTNDWYNLMISLNPRNLPLGNSLEVQARLQRKGSFQAIPLTINQGNAAPGAGPAQVFNIPWGVNQGFGVPSYWVGHRPNPGNSTGTAQANALHGGMAQLFFWPNDPVIPNAVASTFIDQSSAKGIDFTYTQAIHNTVGRPTVYGANVLYPSQVGPDIYLTGNARYQGGGGAQQFGYNGGSMPSSRDTLTILDTSFYQPNGFSDVEEIADDPF